MSLLFLPSHSELVSLSDLAWRSRNVCKQLTAALEAMLHDQFHSRRAGE